VSNSWATIICFVSIVGLIITALPAYAQAPVPSRKETPESLQRKLETEKEAQKALSTKAKAIEKDMSAVQGRLVSAGKKVQGNEETLTGLERDIAALELEKETINGDLQDDQKSIARLVVALQRISRVPPQALVAKPDAPLKTAQSHLLMRDIIPALNKQAEALKDNLARLETLETDLVEKKEDTIQAAATLKKEQSALQHLMSEKKTLYRRANKDLKAQEATIERISLKAKNLSDLVAKLEANQDIENERRTRAQRKASVVGKAPARSSSQSSVRLPKAGSGRLPLPGHIAIAFNESDSFGAPSKGLSIEGRSGALVVAPMGGVVRFAGHFKNYGNMVIVEHQNKYHSLIAGFEKVDTLVGQRVEVGEPLGKLHRKKNGKAPRMYYELRKNSKPVNPATRLAGIG